MVDSTTEADLIEDRAQPVTPGRAFLTLLAAFVALVACLGGYLLFLKVGGFGPPGPRSTVVLFWAATIVAAAVVYGVLIRGGRVSLRQLGFVRPTRRLLHLLWQAPTAIFTSAAVAALVLRLTTGSTVRPSQGDGLAQFASAGPALAAAALVAAVVATPLWEEALFRGALYLGMHRAAGPVAAVVVSAALFAAFHVVPAAWAFLFPLGLWLGWIRWFHRTLWAPIAVHAVNNLLAMSALFLVI